MLRSLVGSEMCIRDRTTATEINVSHFVIEKSTDGSNFSDAGILFATGNTTEEMKYAFSDNLAGNVNDVILSLIHI